MWLCTHAITKVAINFSISYEMSLTAFCTFFFFIVTECAQRAHVNHALFPSLQMADSGDAITESKQGERKKNNDEIHIYSYFARNDALHLWKLIWDVVFYSSAHLTPATTKQPHLVFVFFGVLMKLCGNLSGFSVVIKRYVACDDYDDDGKKSGLTEMKVLAKAFDLLTFWLQSIFNKWERKKNPPQKMLFKIEKNHANFYILAGVCVDFLPLPSLNWFALFRLLVQLVHQVNSCII